MTIQERILPSFVFVHPVKKKPCKTGLNFVGCYTNVVLSYDSTVDTFFFISEISEISPKVTKKENKNHRNNNVNYYLFGNFINVFNRVTSPCVMSYGCIWYYF